MEPENAKQEAPMSENRKSVPGEVHLGQDGNSSN
jgi:hypothetical protein